MTCRLDLAKALGRASKIMTSCGQVLS